MSLHPPEIAYLISRYPSVSHTFIQREIQQLRTQGFTIHVASINPPDINVQQMQKADHDEQAHTFYVKEQGAFLALWKTFKTLISRPLGFMKGVVYCCKLAGADIKNLITHGFYFAEAVLIGAWMQKSQIHHIHVHFANPASTVALILSKIYPVTFSITVHGPDEFYDVTRHHLKEKIVAAQFIFCISYFARSQLMLLSDPGMWSKLVLVRVGVDPMLYSPRPLKEEANRTDILCVGRLTPAKGQALLVEALKLLVDQGKSVLLHLVGDGPERRQLVQQVCEQGLQDRVVFHGALNPQATLEAYAKADIFALASFAEGLPVVLMEAMSREIPCVAPAIHGIPELIQNEENGLLVIPADALALANALARLIDSPTLRSKLGKAGRRTILERFTLQTNTEHLAAQFVRYLQTVDKNG